MVNITHKQHSLRKAVAAAVVTVSKRATIDAIQKRKVPKGDVFEFSRAAALLGIKKTSDVIPDCHPLPVEFAAITYGIDGLCVKIAVEVHTIYKTGVEVEAMHGAAIAALVMYDMLKPIDDQVTITDIRLQGKKGGKSDFPPPDASGLKCAVVVCSDRVSAGLSEDKSGKSLIERLRKLGCVKPAYKVIPDDFEKIQKTARQFAGKGTDLLLFTGGTGLSRRDVTPDALAPLIDRAVPGIMEQARRYGQQRTPYAMLSRGIAGFIGHMLVLALPGSAKGVAETMDAIFPAVLHLFELTGPRHGTTEG